MRNTGVYTEKITTGALLAALFAVTALLFKGFVIVPMITELRVVNAYPVVFGLLFGNVGAWACALGNLLGDIAGSTFSFASLGGFIANYAMAYVPYKVWSVLWRKEDEHRFVLRGLSSYGKFLFLCFLSSIVPAIIIPVFTDILGIVSFNILFVIIFFNDFIASALLGTFIYYMISKLKTGSFLALQAKIMDMDVVRGKKIMAVLLAVAVVFAFLLAVVFTVIYSKEFGQVQILTPMAILSLMMVILMKL